MPIARIYTVFEFMPESPAGGIRYARHLVAGTSFEHAKEMILARAILTTGSSAYMTTDEAAEACRNEVMMSVNLDHDEPAPLTQEQARRWIMMHTTVTVIDGDKVPPSHARIW